MLRAMAMSTEANYRLSVDTTATLGALVGEARRPMTLTEMNDMARLIDQRSARRWVVMNRWGIGIAVAVGFVLGGAYFGAGAWWGKPGLIACDATAIPLKCWYQADTTPPPPPAKH
jgi:hypothetical protein